jgi:hypothetical protein
MATVRPCRPELLPVYCFLHLHDHLAATEEGVADELARAQGNLGVGHGGGCIDLCTLDSPSFDNRGSQ